MSKGIAVRGLQSSPPRSVYGMSQNPEQRREDGDVVEQRPSSLGSGDPSAIDLIR